MFFKPFSDRQVPVDTPETEIGKEPSDNDTNALEHNYITKDIHEHDNDNDKDHIGIVNLNRVMNFAKTVRRRPVACREHGGSSPRQSSN